MNVRPFVYHLAEAENWPSIQRDGLFSTHALLERAGINGSIRDAVEREHRPKRTTLSTGLVIRDQRPMPPASLERCLVGLTAPQWYELLNSKVFFWLDIERLNRQRRACGSFPQGQHFEFVCHYQLYPLEIHTFQAFSPIPSSLPTWPDMTFQGHLRSLNRPQNRPQDSDLK